MAAAKVAAKEVDPPIVEQDTQAKLDRVFRLACCDVADAVQEVADTRRRLIAMEYKESVARSTLLHVRMSHIQHRLTNEPYAYQFQANETSLAIGHCCGCCNVALVLGPYLGCYCHGVKRFCSNTTCIDVFHKPLTKQLPGLLLNSPVDPTK